MQLAVLGEKLAALFNEKAKRRRDVLAVQQKSSVNQGQTYLFHCASLGEYLQVRPLMEKIKAEYPASIVVVSFFSASGFDAVQTDQVVSAKYFLPVDTPKNARRFLQLIKPSFVVLVKYEIWLNFIERCKSLSVPIYLISARFQSEHFYFSAWGRIFRQSLKSLDRIFVQDIASIDVLEAHQIAATHSGDTRADQVLDNLLVKSDKDEWVEGWKDGKPLIICGSIWPEDWQRLRPALEKVRQHYKILIAPHEMHEGFIGQIAQSIGAPVRRWTAIRQKRVDEDIIILDTIGQLASLYRFGDVAYIGGGFKQGLHNIFEPAVWSSPVLFGPQLEKHPEANELVRTGGGFVIETADEIRYLFKKFVQKEARLQAGVAAKSFIDQQAGGTKLIFNKMKEDGWFVNRN